MTDEKAARLAAIRAANAKKAAAAEPPAAPIATPEAETTPAAPAPRVAPRSAQPVVAPAQPADELQSSVALSTFFTLLMAAVFGAFAAVVALPQWLPGLSASLLGAEPKAYWYLSRSSAMVAFGLIWLSMLLGLSITSKAARLWSGGPTIFDAHQFTSLLGLAFGLFHGLILLGDAYIDYSLTQVLLPFGSGGFRPLWVGLGQLALYVLALIDFSFYVRPWIGRGAWRMIHFLSFAVFLLALAHGIGSGTDTQQPLVRAMYWFSGGSLLFVTIYRILITRGTSKAQAKIKLAQRPESN
ncbi:MAG: hypothetical protein JOZ51_24470 [Chloroflexi bacterium]|nr:hypothetical protein [Chloroflexota bacterium]